MNSRHFFARNAAIRAAAMGVTLAVLGSILIFSPAPAHAANCTITGTYGDDVLEGTAGNDVICGSGGNDTINGLGGDDILRGDNGNDILAGGDGTDTLEGGNGRDTLVGGGGNDVIAGGNDLDRLSGGDGDDRLDGGHSDDRLAGEGGNDVLEGGSGHDRLDGGDGDDRLSGNDGDDTIVGAAGNDSITGFNGHDTIAGGPGDDTIDGEEGNDIVLGGPGADSLLGRNGNDTISGGSGNDSLTGGMGIDSCDGSTGVNTFDTCETAHESTAPDNEDLSDSDSDALPDDAELAFGSNPNAADTDGDGLTDAQEFMSVTDPTMPDTNMDGISDPNQDQDSDDLTNAAEFANGTNPIVADADADSLNDGEEVRIQSNPLVADTDADDLSDSEELTLTTDPLVADTDGDGILDGAEQMERTVTFALTNASIDVTGAASAVIDVELRSPTDNALEGVVGMRAPPIEVITDGPVTGTLTVPFNTDGLSSDANLAIVHFDAATGEFDTPADQHIDLANGIATVTTTDFSPFIVVDIDEFTAIWAKEITIPREGSGNGQNIDVALALDSSGSMGWNDPSGQRKVAAELFVDALLPGDRAAVIDFDDSGSVFQPLTENRAAAKAAIRRVDDSGGTNISAAMLTSLGELDIRGLPTHKRIIVLLTDGEGPYSTTYTERAKRSGTTVYTVGLGASTDEALLDGIATATGGKFYLVSNASELEGIFDNIGGDLGAPDSDGDGLADAAESAGMRTSYGAVFTTDPNRADTDGDGLSDGTEMGPIRAGGKYGVGTAFTGASNPNKPDTDGDQLGDAQEWDLETHPRIKDTDGDSLSDLVEVDASFDPLSFNADEDFRFDDQEHTEGTNPVVYDFDLLGNVHAAYSGLIFGDAWDSAWARGLNVNTNVASNGWYLVGQIGSGIIVIGDLRDMVYGVANGDWANAAFAAAAFIPLAGDATRIGQISIRFAGKSPSAVYNALPIVKALPAPHAHQMQKLLAQLPGARLARDVAAGGRALPRANFDIERGGWRDGVARRIGSDPAQAAALQNLLNELVQLRKSGVNVKDVRVNQTQVSADGNVLGINRPDLQYTIDGKRYYVEFDRQIGGSGRSKRGDAHAQRILNNDPDIDDLAAQVVVLLVGKE